MVTLLLAYLTCQLYRRRISFAEARCFLDSVGLACAGFGFCEIGAIGARFDSPKQLQVRYFLVDWWPGLS
jgi:hypothetical protein